MTIINTNPKLILALWNHQIEAINNAEIYISKYNPEEHPGAYLVRMPTGTGKSGVIAVLARCMKGCRNILVVTPWKTIRNQLAEDIKSRFWETVDKKNDFNAQETWPKKVSTFVPSSLESKLLEDIEGNLGKILVCTIQTLQTIFREDSEGNEHYRYLKKNIDLVIVDEGHREPAPEWAKAVRELQKPTILFTATPYRNDHKLFEVNERNVYSFAHDDAESECYIRHVEFKNVHFQRSREGFVHALLDFYNGDFLKIKPETVNEPRVIIRCETSDEVKEITNIIIEEGFPAIGVHENFLDTGDPEYLRKSVPDPKDSKNKFIFWVHQNKLIEGIDDPRFCLLAFYKPLHTGRALVQQVGRIIRNVERFPNQTAYVFTHPEYNLQGFWVNYRKYEKYVRENPDYQERAEWKYIFDDSVAVQPEYLYIEGNYRQRLQFDNDIYPELGYIKSVNIFLDIDGFPLESLASQIQEDWQKKDLIIRKYEMPEENSFVLVYQKHSTSVFITNRYFIEFKVGFTICKRSKGYLFFFDSEGNASEFLLENFIHVPSDVLMRLFSKPGSIIKQVSLRNIDIGRQNIRRRIIYATSLADTVPSLNEHTQFSTTLSGSIPISENEFRGRYVGLSRARVSERENQKITYDQFVEWLDEIGEIINDNRAELLSVLTRYAKSININDNPPIAKSIQFDNDEFEDLFKHISSGKNIKLDNTYYDIEGGKFTFQTLVSPKNSPKLRAENDEITITYNKKNKKYKLEAKELGGKYVRRNPENNHIEENIIAYFNKVQPFRIGFETTDYIYSFGKYLQPQLHIFNSPGQRNQLELLTLFTPMVTLSKVESEKGKACKVDGTGWQDGCLFDVIDNLAKYPELKALENTDYLICDDMGTEIADFIAISKSRKSVTLIHAKVNEKTTKYSAKAFQEVCAQAIKNLSWINPYSERINKSLDKWNNPWRAKLTEESDHEDFVTYRIRIPKEEKPSPKEIWDDFTKIIRDTQSTKEVWIMLGRGFSLGDFEKQRAIKNPRPEIVHIFYILQSTWNIVDSLGAKLRIFCSP